MHSYRVLTKAKLTRELIGDFLGSNQIFAAAAGDILDTGLLRDIRAGVTAAQIRVLKLIGQAGVARPAELAAHLGVSRAAAEKEVAALAGRKLITRRAAAGVQHPGLALSAAGRSLLARFEAARARRLAGVFHRLPSADLKHAAEVLDRLAAGIVTASAGPEEICRQCGVYFKERCLLQAVVLRHCAANHRPPRRNREGTTT
jgi:DNA-binding MarR family transcriptional regulator